MNRSIVSVAIKALIVIFSVPVVAQGLAEGSQEKDERPGDRPLATLTTADTLNPQDFAPIKKAPAAARGLKVEAEKDQSSAKAGKFGKLGSSPEVIGILAPELTSQVPNGQSESVSLPDSTITTGDAKLDTLILNAATRNGLDHRLIHAVMRQESSFNARAVSPKGAGGLMQLMPATARRFGVQNLFDPAQSIEGGAQYLRFLLDIFGGDVELALAGYNAGEGAVARYGNRVPPYRETQDYVRRIVAHYNRLTSLTAGGSVRPRTIKLQPAAQPKNKLSETEVITGTRSLSQY